MRLAPLIVPAAMLAACGSVQGPSSAAPQPSLPITPGAALTATDHGWTTSAAIGIATRTIDVTVTVPGPISVDGGCIPSLSAWTVGADSLRLQASPSPALHCGALTIRSIPAGQIGTFGAGVPLPPPGTYAVHGLLRTHLPTGAGMRVRENVPVVTITVP